MTVSVNSCESSEISISAYSDDSSYSDIGSMLHEQNEEANDKTLDDEFEHKAVKCFRMFVFFLLISAMAAAGSATWYFITNDEREDFQNDYDNFGLELSEGSSETVRIIVDASKSLSNTITNLGVTAGSQWPFFVDNNFHMTASTGLNITGAKMIAIVPFVDVNDRLDWETFAQDNQMWVRDGLEWRAEVEGFEIPDPIKDIPTHVYRRDATGDAVPEDTNTAMVAPLWQMARAPADPSTVNYDFLSHPILSDALDSVMESKTRVLSEVIDSEKLFRDDFWDRSTIDGASNPTSILFEPIMSNFDDENVVGALVLVLPWEVLLSSHSIHMERARLSVVVENDCDQTYSFSSRGNQVTFLGNEDVHDNRWNEYEQMFDFAPFLKTSNEECQFSFQIYPSKDMYKQYASRKPAVITTVIVIVFFCTSLIFCLYDCAVHMRQRRILQIASQSEKILSILYPKTIRERLFGSITVPGDHHSTGSIGATLKKTTARRKKKAQPQAAKTKLKSYLNDDAAGNTGNTGTTENSSDFDVDMFETKPIADLFPNTTVMFADIAGFTAWSSVREPAQVFTLLETVYRAFDAIAKRRRVFKVETVGDCYVAVTGLPEPRRDHAVAMVRFARECLIRFNELVRKMETRLGPDTGDLAIRVGLHSGPVTAGVLRGDKSRFQLFGDTVNTAARIESTGRRNKIHMSRETAELLQIAGKGAWLERREEAVEAKGKGRLQTFWLAEESTSQGNGGLQGNTDINSDNDVSDTDTIAVVLPDAPPRKPLSKQDLRNSSIEEIEATLPIRVQRLVHWNVDVLTRLLKQIVVKRRAMGKKRYDDHALTKMEEDVNQKIFLLDEVVEIIPLPQFDHKVHLKQEDPDEFELSDKVVNQTRHYVAAIAAMHPDNAFHNFEHASHVMMSVSKLLSRIIAPDEVLHAQAAAMANNGQKLASSLHDHTYGITSDPMTQFSVILAALIHDVDHAGVSNFQLIKENNKLASMFKNKSVAEQNSILLAWNKLMEPRFLELRRCIYADVHEFQRFRQLITNSVLATDIFDKELSAIRRNRWDMAFKSEADADKSSNAIDSVNRKATIVIEHLIQASDVAHTMQHWHVYRKWNERLFHEMTVAYKAGRMEKNPADNWYKGELGFYDNYIIPLARKLKDCGVFGVSSEEYLNYALENRSEWEIKGEEVVAHLIATYQPPEQESKEEDFSEDQDDPPSSKRAIGIRSSKGKLTLNPLKTSLRDLVQGKESKEQPESAPKIALEASSKHDEKSAPQN